VSRLTVGPAWTKQGRSENRDGAEDEVRLLLALGDAGSCTASLDPWIGRGLQQDIAVAFHCAASLAVAANAGRE